MRAAADQIDDHVGELVSHQPGALVAIVTVDALSDRFAIAGILEIPQTGFGRKSTVLRPQIPEGDELSVDSRLCPILGLDVTRAAELPYRIIAAADDGHTARVIQVVHKDLIENRRMGGSFGIRCSRLELRKGDLDADDTLVRSCNNLLTSRD